MSNKENSKITTFLSNFPKSEIIQVLRYIDNRISELHDASSKDFMYFNKLLKQYYSRVKEISEANNQINNFFRKDLSSFIEEGQSNNSLNQKTISNIASDIGFMSGKLTSAYSSFDLLLVPFNNYKQNLITLKYLLANINLHLSYVELSNKDKIRESVSNLNNSITNATDLNEQVSDKKEDLVQKLTNLKQSACVFKSKNNTEVNENLSRLDIELKKLNKEEYWPDNFIHRINNHSQNCFSNMSEIITNLQFHDIIRQKMEHIQSSQKDLISGISKIDSNNAINDTEDQLKLIFKIPEITELQVAQLLYTNKDYQTSIEKITNKLIEVGREMKELNSLYITIAENTESFQVFFIKQVTETQKTYIQFIRDFKKNWENTSVVLNQTIDNYQSLKSIFNNIFNEEKNIRKEIVLFEKLVHQEGNSFSPDLIKRLLILISDLKINSNSLKNSLNNITSHVSGLKSIVDALNKESQEVDNPNIKIDELNSNVGTIKSTCIEYSEMSLDISNEITESLKNIQYYNFFEKTVSEIVEKLNMINKQVNYEELKKEIVQDGEMLEDIEKLYTMKSERDIHHKLVDSGMSVSEMFDQQADESEDDNDIELF